MQSHKESDDGYATVIARLNDRWRVIVCRDGIQWILQYSKKTGPGMRWRGRCYCTTRKALMRCVAQFAGRLAPDALAVLGALPEKIARPRAGRWPAGEQNASGKPSDKAQHHVG